MQAQNTLSHQKLISRLLSKRYLGSVKSNGFRILRDRGFFNDPLFVNLNYEFIPWLLERTYKKVHTFQATRLIGHEFAEEVKENTRDFHKKAIKSEQTRKDDIITGRKERRQARAEKRSLQAEEKKLQDETQALQDFKDNLIESFMKSNNPVRNVLEQRVADVDGNG